MAAIARLVEIGGQALGVVPANARVSEYLVLGGESHAALRRVVNHG